MVVGGRTARYGTAGTGAPVVFLHGWGISDRAYEPALRRLATSGVRVVAPALPGFGGTPALAAEHQSFTGYADWLADFTEAVGITEPAVVVGHSFGGGVAIMFAHRHQERTRGLVLVNSVGGSAWREHRSVLRSMADRPLWDWGLHLSRDLLPWRQLTRVLPVIVSEAVPNLVRDPRTFMRAAAVARSADLATELEELRDRGLPVVVLWGAKDRVVPEASVDALCEAVGVTRTTLEGGHGWLIGQPDAFSEVMTNVLELVDEGPRRERRTRWWRRGDPRRSDDASKATG